MIFVFWISFFIWYARVNIVEKNLRILAALIILSAQILIQVYLTFEGSPLKLNHIPYLHFLVLTLIGISCWRNIREIQFFSYFKTVTVRKSRIKMEVFNLIARYWYVPLLFLLISVGTYPALLGGPSTVDERAYHWPQILGIVQQNGFTTFDTSLPWTYTYPLGKAAAAAFTWPFIETDLAFRSTQILFGFIALTALYSIGKNLSQNVAILTPLILAASPVFAVMIRMSADDLGYGAFVLGSVALLIAASAQANLNIKRKLYFFSILSFAISGQFKFPVISAILLMPLFITFLLRRSESNKEMVGNFALLFLGGLISFAYAIRNFFEYRNPFYPMQVAFGSLIEFNGPLISVNNENIGASSTFSLNEPFRLLKIWHATFFDYFQTPNEDSLGSYNFLVGILLIAVFVLGMTQFGKLNSFFKVLFCTILVLFLGMPGIFLPRYGYFIVFIAVIFALNSLSPLIPSRKEIMLLTCMILAGFVPVVLQNIEIKNWIYSQTGKGDVFSNGQSYIDRQYDLSPDSNILPSQLVTWIQANVKEKQVVCFAAATDYPSLFWNLERTSIVQFAPVLQEDRYPNSNNSSKIYTAKQIASWLENREMCDYLVGYEMKTQFDLFKGTWEKMIEDKAKDIWILRRIHQ
jgi:hypothetical protein